MRTKNDVWYARVDRCMGWVTVCVLFGGSLYFLMALLDAVVSRVVL